MVFWRLTSVAQIPCTLLVTPATQILCALPGDLPPPFPPSLRFPALSWCFAAFLCRLSCLQSFHILPPTLRRPAPYTLLVFCAPPPPSCEFLALFCFFVASPLSSKFPALSWCVAASPPSPRFSALSWCFRCRPSVVQIHCALLMFPGSPLSPKFHALSWGIAAFCRPDSLHFLG